MRNTLPSSEILLAYADRLSATPGETLDILASCTEPLLTLDVVRLWCGDEHPEGPGARSTPVTVPGEGEYRGTVQPVARGSFGLAALAADIAADSFTIAVSIWPTAPRVGRRQGVLTRPGQFALAIDAAGALVLEVGGGELRVTPGPAERRWTQVVASYDAATGRAALTLRCDAWPPRTTSFDQQVSPVPGPVGDVVLIAAGGLQ